MLYALDPILNCNQEDEKKDLLSVIKAAMMAVAGRQKGCMFPYILNKSLLITSYAVLHSFNQISKCMEMCVSIRFLYSAITMVHNKLMQRLLYFTKEMKTNDSECHETPFIHNQIALCHVL